MFRFGTSCPLHADRIPPAKMKCLERYPALSIAALYFALIAGTAAQYWGDTIDYARDSLSQQSLFGTPEFGHLLWRPIGYAAVHIAGGLVGALSGYPIAEDPDRGEVLRHRRDGSAARADVGGDVEGASARRLRPHASHPQKLPRRA
jgi:hypothetical protein